MENETSEPHAFQRRIDRIVMWIKWRRYLKTRGWAKDKMGWYRWFNPLLPPEATFYHEPRYMSRDGIDIYEAIKLARNSDPNDSYIYT